MYPPGVATPTRPERRVGTVIDGKYELRRLLGMGATGSVYEAWHRYTARSVAVKVLHDHMVTNREAVGRFMREVRAASAIGHPVIVAVLDAGVTEEGGPPYMVQELLAGREMEKAMLRGELAVADIVEIGRQLLDGLAAAHAHRIIHRDVKPENVFLLRNDVGALQVKLVDFGVAKAIDSKTVTAALTLPGNTVGTPYYMSPEQARADPVDERTDIWSVGAVLFHAATGRPPFDSRKALGDLLYKIVMTRAPRIRSVAPSLPDNLAEAVDRALEPDPDARWPSARAMCECLRRTSASIAGLDWDDD